MTERVRLRFFISLVLVVATFLIFAKVGGHDFISYDDNLYVTDNQMVQGGLSWSGFVWAFTTVHSANWHPITWLSHMLDMQLFGLRPGAHHLVNVLFHSLNTVLLFLILARITGAIWRSAFVAALFAVHPLHVESVAWVSERKDVLSTFFGFLTIWVYVRYTERPGMTRYLWVVLLLVLGLLSKPMLVTMPFLLILLDYWPLGRMQGGGQSVTESNPVRPKATLSQLLVEKIPLLVICTASGIVTLIAQKKGEAMADLSLGLGLRIANAAVGYARYLGKTFWPVGLSIFYPHPGAGIPVWQVAGASFLLLTVTGLVLMRLRQSPWLAVGWFWFMVALVPVIGIVQVGAQSIADRYTYIPLVGIFIMIAWEVPELLKRWRIGARALGIASALVLLLLSSLTWRQLDFWKNHETLFRHAISVTKDNCVALSSLADYLARKGNVDEAYSDLNESLRLCPKDEEAWYNLGVLQRNRGEMAEAENSLREALRLKPRYTKAWSNLGSVYMAQGRMAEAIEALLEAARVSPDDASVWFNLGFLYGKNGQPEEAVEAYCESVLLKPAYWAAWNNLGITYKNLGRISEAAAAFGQAAQIRPDDPMAWYNLGILYANTGDFTKAIGAFRNAVRVRPDHAASWYEMGMAYSSMGRQQEAGEVVRTLQSLDPGLAEKLSSRIGQSR
ncbi:MAG: tetratricopeptide repeat protein [Nitrospiraceae bacterium]|nr:tetratricopeptide repeat protein [Nitrospiraceae bacterium]